MTDTSLRTNTNRIHFFMQIKDKQKEHRVHTIDNLPENKLIN